MSKVYKALAFSVSSKYLNQLLNLLSIVYVARMLSPEELGVFAIASALVLIAAELKSFGASNYIIREKEISVNDVQNALGVSVTISWGIGLALILSSWAIESFYQQRDIASLIHILSISFFLSPHIGVGKALLSRNFEFKPIFYAESISTLVKFMAVIVLILMDYSYFSIACSTAIGFIVELLIVIVFRPKRFVVLPKFNKFSRVFKFGVYDSFSNVFRASTISLPDLIIGKLGTTSQVAFFSRGLGLLNFLTMMISSGIRPVVAPFLADKKREGGSLEEPYLKASAMLGVLVIPILAVAGFAGLPTITFFFGSQWSESASLVGILCLWSIFRFVHSQSPSLFIAEGYEKLMFYKELIVFLITGVFIYLFFPMGLEMVAWGMTLASILDCMIVSVLIHKYFNIRLINQLKANILSFFVAILCVSWCFVLSQWVDFASTQPGLIVLILAISNAVVWLLSVYFLKHPIMEPVGKVIKAVRVSLNSKKMSS